MNAVPQLQPTDQAEREQAERRARHLSVCQELIDIGMKLARRAGERALQADANPPPPEAPPARDEDQTFARLSATIRLAVKLEAQIAANAFARPASVRPANASANTQEPPASNLQVLLKASQAGILSSALYHLTEDHEDRWQLRETINEIIEDTLDTFPEKPLSEHFVRTCLALDIEPDLASLPADTAQFLIPDFLIPEIPVPGQTPAAYEPAAAHRDTPPPDRASWNAAGNAPPPERWPRVAAA